MPAFGDQREVEVLRRRGGIDEVEEAGEEPFVEPLVDGFLDEPTTGFDPEARRRCWSAIENLSGLGKTILLTTHYLDEADRLADRVAILAGGHIRAVGTSQELADLVQAPTLISFAVPSSCLRQPCRDHPHPPLRRCAQTHTSYPAVPGHLPRRAAHQRPRHLASHRLQHHRPRPSRLRCRPAAGALGALAVTLILGITCFAALGFAISAFIPNGAAAGAIINGTYIPLALISGTFNASVRLPRGSTRRSVPFPSRRSPMGYVPATTPPPTLGPSPASACSPHGPPSASSWPTATSAGNREGAPSEARDQNGAWP